MATKDLFEELPSEEDVDRELEDLPYKFYLMVHSKDETARLKSDFRFSKK